MRKYKDIGLKNENIYLDHAAATPVRSEVANTLSVSLSLSANPSSIHKEGIKVRAAIESARKDTAVLLGALAHEIVFTSGSTEGLNIAIQGVFKEFKGKFKHPHVVTSAIEHPSILETLRALEGEGLQVTYLEPDQQGVIKEGDLRESLREETLLVVFSYVNGEIGNTLPVESIAKTLRNFKRHNTGERYPYFLLDATQAASVLPLNIQKLGVDMLVIDGAKIGGIKGSGLLFLRNGVEISPIIFGGGQEGALRPGTPNAFAIESLALSLGLAQAEVPEEAERLRALSDYFIQELESNFPTVIINGDRESRAPHIVSVCFRGMDAEWLTLMLDARGVSVSRGSACKSGKGNESEVLAVIRPDCASSSIRFSLGRETTKEELKRVIEILVDITANQSVHTEGSTK